MTRGVDSGEKTLHTTFGDECKFLKFSLGSKARRKTIAEKTSLTTIVVPFKKRQVIWRHTSFESTET